MLDILFAFPIKSDEGEMGTDHGFSNYPKNVVCSILSSKGYKVEKIFNSI